MYLVDTSVWIDLFRKRRGKAVDYFQQALDRQLPFGITSVIFQEILQGAATEIDFKELLSYLETQRFYHPKNNLASYQAAARLYFDCKRKGMTIRSSIDCLIAQIAVEHNLILIHNDTDFVHIKKISPELQLYELHDEI